MKEREIPSMNIRIILNVALIAACVLSGCTTPPPPPPPPAPKAVEPPPPPPVVKPAPKPHPKPKPLAPSPMKVSIRYGGGSSRVVEDRAVAAMKNELSKAGYIVDGAGEPDIVITATGHKKFFDRTGKSAVYEGSLRLHAEAKGKSPFFIEEKTLSAKGKRGIDDAEAEKFLADALVQPVGAWSKNAAGRGKDRIAKGGKK
ncbi:MAG: hypothetical protein IJC66_00130 [Kiritimatiellae bacterium]|nr:hypothetical protein [Kiritimatiellia bacterium]